MCIAIDRWTKEQLGDEMVVEAENEYFARHVAMARFQDNNHTEKREWCIDSMKLDD
jgi:hypothetical protein